MLYFWAMAKSEWEQTSICVNYHEAQAFLAWKSVQDGIPYTLPLVAELLDMQTNDKDVVFSDKEWTLEGFLYIPKKKKILEKPNLSVATANFRSVNRILRPLPNYN